MRSTPGFIIYKFMYAYISYTFYGIKFNTLDNVFVNICTTITLKRFR